MKKQPIEGVIFDCDGTLVDSESLSISILLELVSEFGLILPYQQTLRQFAGNDLSVVFRSLEQKIGHAFPNDFLKRFRERQIAVLKEQVQAIHGAADLLGAMTLPVCVASNAPLNKINVCLETTGLHRYFTESRIFSAYQINTWKPAPDLFLVAAKSLGIAPECCAVVEDSSFGIDAGLSAGMQVFAFDPCGAPAHDERVTVVRCLTELKPRFCD